MVIKHAALERIWETMREQYADIVAQPMPVKFLVKLCELRESETLVMIDLLKAGDVVRLKVGSNEMLVSKVLDTETIECTHFDGVQQVTASVPVADVVKVGVPRDTNLPLPGGSKDL
jgi:uncharacterized protein YodC (DUF2158 family)